MIRDHNAATERALALLAQLDVAAQDNFLSRQLNGQSDQLVAEMSGSSGAAFDRRYAENELAYHRAVNSLVESVFISNIENAEVKALLQRALTIFKAHERHAEMMVAALARSGA